MLSHKKNTISCEGEKHVRTFFIRDLIDERRGRKREGAHLNFHEQRIILRGSRRIFFLNKYYVPNLCYKPTRKFLVVLGWGDRIPQPSRRSPPWGRTSLSRCYDLTLTYSAYYRLADTERSGIGLPEFRLAQRRYLIGTLDIPSPIRFPFRLLTRNIIRRWWGKKQIFFKKQKKFYHCYLNL